MTVWPKVDKGDRIVEISKFMKALFSKHTHSFWDKIGMTVSSICFFHCMATPVLLLTLPAMGEYFDDPIFHIFIFLLVVPVGLYAFLQGYRHHRKKPVLLLGLPGLLIVGFGAFIPHAWAPGFAREGITVLGSLLLIAAHSINRKACRLHKYIDPQGQVHSHIHSLVVGHENCHHDHDHK